VGTGLAPGDCHGGMGHAALQKGTQGQKNGHAEELHGQKICFLKSGIAQE
jgi:hypothetical protein